MRSAPAWPPCRAARQTRVKSVPVSQPQRERDGSRSAGRSLRLSALAPPGAIGAGRGTTGRRRRRWARRRPSLAWKLDDRAAPDTVPMKAVPQQCGPLGRLRPALPAQSGCAVGPSSPFVPVRRVPRSGRFVQPLRSRQPVLQPHLLASDARPCPTRGGLSLPAFARWERPARGEVAALAPAHRTAGRGGRRRRHHGPHRRRRRT